MKNLFCELLSFDHKIKSLVVVDRFFNMLFGEIDLLFYLKTFLFFKIQKRHRAVSNNNQSNFPFKVSSQSRKSEFNVFSIVHLNIDNF